MEEQQPLFTEESIIEDITSLSKVTNNEQRMMIEQRLLKLSTKEGFLKMFLEIILKNSQSDIKLA